MMRQGYRLFAGRLFWVYWFPVIFYCLVLFVQSSLPSAENLTRFPHQDKVLHFVAYAVMGGLFSRALQVTQPSLGWFHISFFSICYTTLYGAGDELHQMFVPGRMADWNDLAADFVGGVFGAVCYCRVLGRRRQLKNGPTD